MASSCQTLPPPLNWRAHDETIDTNVCSSAVPVRIYAVPPYPLFREVLAAGNLHHAMRLARELPTVPLGDAARLLALMARDDQTVPETYERGAIRWVHRLTGECRALPLADCAVAVAALDRLDVDPRALEMLLRLCASSPVRRGLAFEEGGRG